LIKSEAIALVNELENSNKLTPKNVHWSNIVNYKKEKGWWLNIPFEKFQHDLYLILNQPDKQSIILLTIPANSLKPIDTFRDKDGKADIFIPYDNNIFVDTQSNGTKYHFLDYKRIPYNRSRVFNHKDFINEFEKSIIQSKNDSQQNRINRLKKSKKKPLVIEVTSLQFKRNPDVVVEVLNRANGICERCKNKAPFLRKKDNSPYLEVHHIVTLADGGNDTVENAIAVCPNCHRELHFG